MLEVRTINLRLMTEKDLEELVKLENIYKEQGEWVPPAFHSLAERKMLYEDKSGRAPGCYGPTSNSTNGSMSKALISPSPLMSAAMILQSGYAAA